MQIREPDFQFIRQLVYDQSSIQLGQEKKEMVCTRLNNRLTHLGLANVAEYCELLKSNREPNEVTHLIDALSTNFTTFFREIEHFKFLKEKIFAHHRDTVNGERKEPLRAWSAACSTGEEPYSMAIVMASCFRAMDPALWQIFASDISTRVLEKATQGIYEATRINLPNSAWLPRYFQKGVGDWSNHYRVKRQLREQIDFQHMNLLHPPQPLEEKYHFIFCRNVMIYFDHATVQKLVEGLFEQLHEGGYLIIGHAESLDRKPPGLKQIRSSIFKRVSR
ncbi:MAG TPA: protein-glutamate O-methyltransferase CheR [Candidatus Methylacidiphilales bacterium]